MKSKEWKVKSKASEYLELGMWVKNEKWQIGCEMLLAYFLRQTKLIINNTNH